MSIEDYSTIARPKWKSFVDGHIHGTVFHTEYIYNVYASTPHFKPYAFFSVNEDGRITAMLTGFLQTVKPGLLSSVSTRSVMLQAPIYSDVSSLSSLLEHYIKWARDKAVYTEIRNHYQDEAYAQCLQNSGFIWEGHYNIVRELPQTTEILWKEVGRKRKDGINKAKRFDFSVCVDNSTDTIDSFYSLLVKNYSQLKLPIPDRVFFNNCLTKDDYGCCKFFKLSDMGEAKIVLLALIYHDTLHAVYIGTDQTAEFVSKRPVDLFYYEVMRWCLENNVRYFDWLGAGKPNVSYGVRDFKLQYGGELIDFGRFNYIHSHAKFKIATTGFKLLQRMKGKI